MASIEKRPRQDGLASWRAHYRTPSGERATRPSTAKPKPSGSSRASSHQKHRVLRRLGARADHGGGLGHTLARQPDVPQAVHPRALCGDHPRAHPTQLGPGEARQRLQCRRAEVGNSAVEDPLTRDRPQGPPCALTDLNMAVKDGRLARNVATGVNLPRPSKEQQRFLTHAQVEAIAEAFARPSDVSKHRRLDDARTRPTGSSSCSSLTPASDSARWPHSGEPS